MALEGPSGERVCQDCGTTPADLPIVEESGEFGGWLCEACDRKRRHRHMGWSRRSSRRIRRWLRL